MPTTNASVAVAVAIGVRQRHLEVPLSAAVAVTRRARVNVVGCRVVASSIPPRFNASSVPSCFLSFPFIKAKSNNCGTTVSAGRVGVKVGDTKPKKNKHSASHSH